MEEAPPSCAQIASANDPTSCEVTLLAMQAFGLGTYKDIPNLCGFDGDDEPINPMDNPTCEALNSCCGTIQNSLDSTVCGFIQGLHFVSSCDYGIAYFKSKGECSDAAIDAGTWPGLAPVHEASVESFTDTSGFTNSTSISSSK
jgi:hypothetical protein